MGKREAGVPREYLAVTERAYDQAIVQIRAKTRIVDRHEASFGLLSTGEKIAVALVLNRIDLLQFWGTILEGADRVGPEWLAAALQVQREGWENE